MAELKTRPTGMSVTKYLGAIPDEGTRRDCREVMKMMKAATGSAPKMWGPSIVGFGDYRYEYASGRTGDWFLAGFSPRKQNLTLYLMSGFRGFEPLMRRLGRHKASKCCLYIKRLDDVDRKVLTDLIGRSVRKVKKGRRPRSRA